MGGPETDHESARLLMALPSFRTVDLGRERLVCSSLEDCDQAELVERYREDPSGTVAWWEAEQANRILNCADSESSTWLRFDETERQALSTHDYPKLFELGAHPFLTLTLYIGLFERDYEPLGFQTEYAQRLSHVTLPHPDIAT